MIATRSKILCAGLIAVALTNQSWAANECDIYKERAAYYQKLRNMGGSADEMNYWTAKGHELDDKIYLCQRDTTINPVVHIATNDAPTQIPADTPATTKHLNVPLRSSISDDTQLLGLIQTCNYWIKLSNENATQDNIKFRDIACSAVDKHQDTPRDSSASGNHSVTGNQSVPDNQSVPSNQNRPSTTAAVRKLKDCIKPNNHIDHEVNECVKGNIEPIWKK